jgi:eukaryotic-like serine/threonine-protein kinase
MGEVYRATDSVLHRIVAVKMLADRHARNPEVRTRFKREALAAAQLSAHRNVVTVFDVGEHQERPFIVMEFLEGGSVHDRLRSGPIEPDLALDWLEQAADGLDAAHARGIVHRDVKPANLLLDVDGNVHVTDFGIASAAGLDTLTIPGTVLGTAGYLAPEQARGEPATAASDRYGLAVVAFELLTGRRPFAADTPVTEAFAHLNAEVPSARQMEPGLPAGVDTVLGRALAKEPGDRPSSARALVDDLRDAFRTEVAPTLVQGPPAPAAPAATPARSRPVTRTSHRARRPTAYAVVALGVLVAGLGTAALIAAVDDDRSPQRTGASTSPASNSSTTETTDPGATTETTDTETTQRVDGEALNNEGYSRMRKRDFEGALPLLERAVSALAGSGSLAEAYASYNLAFTRFALGSCEGVPELLDRSEAVQGERKPIDRLRRQVERDCFGKGKRGDGGGGDGND